MRRAAAWAHGMVVDSTTSDPRVDVPTVIDIEASGFGRGSYPIEVGFVLPDGRSDCMLIRPADHWLHWDPAAEALHGIARDTLVAHGWSIADVAKRLNRQLDGMTVYSDAWGYDFTWLSTLYDEASCRPAFRLESLTRLLSPDELDRWDAVKRAVFRTSSQDRHRASADARLLQATLVRVHTTSATS